MPVAYGDDDVIDERAVLALFLVGLIAGLMLWAVVVLGVLQ
jgi:hypothetical protein